MQTAIAFVFPGIEDFGILPVEVQATGTPVLALGRGGATETVVDDTTGLLYEEDSLDCVVEAMRTALSRPWSPDACRRNAEQFARPAFEAQMTDLLAELGTRTKGQVSSD